MSEERLLIVTPMRNEESNVAGLHSTLSAQSWSSLDWVVVDDGSTDETLAALEKIASGIKPFVVRKSNDGGLIGGSAYTSWRYGVSCAPRALEKYSHVMKLDADVRLEPKYLQEMVMASGGRVGLVGGVLRGLRHREQTLHVPGPVKLYTREAYVALDELPSSIGFDVMDEVLLLKKKFEVKVLQSSSIYLSRGIGMSEGGIHGRFRNGRVCRWTGYYLPYFLLHAVRYLFRKPILIGSCAMVVGYFRADHGPYPKDLKRRHRKMQEEKIRSAVKAPVAWFSTTYGTRGS